jgi:hypothetical protein
METTQKKRPYTVQVVEEREDGKRHWTQVGVAFPHKKGRGFSIRLTAIA